MISSWCQYVVNISHCINCESVWRLFTIEFKAHAPQKIWWSSFDIGNSTSQAQDFYVQMSSHPCKPPMLQPARVASMARWKGGPPRRFGWQPWSTECCCFFFMIEMTREKVSHRLWLSQNPADTSWALPCQTWSPPHWLLLAQWAAQKRPQGNSGCGNSRESR